MEPSKNNLSIFKKAFQARATQIPIVIGICLIILNLLTPLDRLLDFNSLSTIEKIENDIQKVIKEFKSTSKTSFDTLHFENKNIKFPNAIKNNFAFFIFDRSNTNYSLTFWQNNYSNWDTSFLTSKKEMDFDVNYIYLKKQIDSNKIAICLIDVSLTVDKYWQQDVQIFDTENKHKNYTISKKAESNDYKINIGNNNHLYIKKINTPSDLQNIYLILLFLLQATFILYGIHNFFKITVSSFPLISTILYVFLIYASKSFLMHHKIPSFLYQLKLFNNSLYSGTSLNPSLGDFLFFILLNQILIIFVYKRVFFNLAILKKLKIGFLVHTLVLIFFLGETFSVVKIFKSLVLDSSIWYNFNFFPRISIYSIVGLSIMLITFSNYYLLSKKALKTIWKIEISNVFRFASFTITYIISLSLLLLFKLGIAHFIVLNLLFISFLIIYIGFYYKIRFKYATSLSFILFASILTTFLLHESNFLKETYVKNSLASEISFKLNKELIKSITYHFECRSILDNECPHPLKKNIELTVDTLNSFDFNKKDLKYKEVYQNNRFKIFSINDLTQSFYIVKQTDKNIFYKIYNQNFLNKLNPNVKSSIHNQVIGQNYINYAIYINDTLKEYNGQYPFNKIFNYNLNSNNEIIEYQETKNYVNQVYNYGKDLKVIITTYSLQPISIFALFSYIFCFNIILYLIYYIISSFIKFYRYRNIKFSYSNVSLRQKIIISIIILIFAIFATIASISFINLKKKNEEYKKEYLINKLNSIELSVNKAYDDKIFNLDSNLIQFISQLSKSNNVNIHIYKSDGALFYQSNLMEDKKTSEILHPLLMSNFKKSKLKNIYKITENNKKQFVATNFIYFENANQSIILTLSIDAESNWAKNDLTNFIISLINIYVFLFLLAIIVALGISNLITEPLNMLIGKLSKIAFSQKNELIEYKNNDEIGQFIKQYNHMVINLENSLDELASNQRELAWREMAKQIAHEIKNPLTPMKLKIQLLQKNIKEEREDALEMTEKVCRSLIEQIDNLSNIANEFSNFARLKTPDLERVNLVSICENVTALFESVKDSNVIFNTSLKEACILGDKDQLVSCLNNIIKNGIQAAIDKNIIPKVEVDLIEVDSIFKLIIKDNGGGIPVQISNKIFEPNFTTKSSGTGLGLAITKKFVEQMNGKIYFETNYGIGTTFTFEFKKEKANS
jgi:signal transduction histidine kinase